MNRNAKTASATIPEVSADVTPPDTSEVVGFCILVDRPRVVSLSTNNKTTSN